ncbi:MAG: octanoyltransferase [Gracilibacter sp. BRH_c7a]|nr:MAG: octanoyltransferase [Gracilibacter sp. BRH_c7a]
MKIKVVRLKRMDYKESLAIQEKLLEMRQLGDVEDVLLMVEHPPVLTLGRNGNPSNILLTRKELIENGVNIYEVGRGGDVTYHGPGQIVGYPIIDLSNHGKDIKDFVWKIEEVFIRLLKEEFNINAHREDEKNRGVWVEDKKITAIGIAVKRWVTMHGFAFNVNTQLEHFRWINPCGITDKGVTSLQKILGHPKDFEQINQLVLKYFCEVFDIQYEIADAKTFLGSYLQR